MECGNIIVEYPESQANELTKGNKEMAAMLKLYFVISLTMEDTAKIPITRDKILEKVPRQKAEK